SLTVEDAQNLGSFSAVTTLKDGTKIGRMTAVTNYILKMIDKLDSPPTAEAYQTLLKTIRNTRDQAELRFRLHERFPDKF
ncbi:MAG: hypothetical protein ACXVBW_02635, partial [Bdellovibrionota bacterium]